MAEHVRAYTYAKDLAEWAEVARSMFPATVGLIECDDGTFELHCGDLRPFKLEGGSHAKLCGCKLRCGDVAEDKDDPNAMCKVLRR